MVALLFLVGSPLSAAKPIKTDVPKEKKAPLGKVKTPIVEEPSDTTAPVITLNGASPMDVTQGDTFTDPDATATDDTDGSVTVSATGSVDTSTVGTYAITYSARDTAGNIASKIRTVNVTATPDTTAPVITLNGSNLMDLTQGDTFTDPGATATDDMDGSITVSATGSVDTSTVGTYTITYIASDSAANTATKTRTVNVIAEPDTTTTDDEGTTGTDSMDVTVTTEGGTLYSLESRVSSSANDAEERASGSMYLNSSDLELVYDDSFQAVGTRFSDLSIPQNATITKAYIQFKADEVSLGITQLSIHGENIGNAAAFNSTTHNISSRTKTATSVSWSPADWSSIGAAGEIQRTPDLTSIIQEIVSGSGWQEGNAIVLIITGSGKRVAESYDGDQSGAPLFYVEYTTAVPPENIPPTANVAAAPIVEETPTCITGDAGLEGILKDSATGVVLANVSVSVGGCTTTTDANGVYTLSDLSANEEAVINFEKEGYLQGSVSIQLKILSGDDTVSSNYLEYTMHAHDKQWNYDSSEQIASTHITVDASVAYIDSEEKPYNGTIAAYLTLIDITTDEGKDVFTGAFKGINTNGEMVQFDSYGLISILLKDSNGNTVELADEETATLGFDAVSSLEKPSTLPLWYYDYEQGLWVEEGYAELQEDGSYQGDIPHLGTWSLNRPIEDAPGIYRGRIVYTDGTPAQDIRIHAVGTNWSSSDLSTDSEGIFEIKVIPDSSFQLKAYNYKDKYEAVYNGTIQAIASGEIIEDII